MTDRTDTTAASLVPSSRVITAGCDVLYERVAEAHEPEWRNLVARIYIAMRAKAGVSAE